MTLPQPLMLLAGLLVLSPLIQPLARRLRLPFALLLVITGFASAGLVYYGIDHASGFPWIAALLTGALLSATDPLAMMELCRRIGVPERLVLLMEGESLFNDATSIVIFVIFLYLAQHPAEPVSFADATVGFGLLFFGGALVGLLIGMVFLLLIQRFDDPVEHGLLTLVSAYAAFLTAEWLLQVSGVMAPDHGTHDPRRLVRIPTHTAVAPPASSITARPGDTAFVARLWSLNAFIAHTLVFLLMGMTITVDTFHERWLAMLIGIAGVLVARTVGLLGVLPLVGKLPGIQPISVREQVFMVWGDLRGAVTLALALSLPVELDYWWTIQSIAFGVVLFTLAVQAPAIPLLVRWLGLGAATSGSKEARSA